MFDLALAIALHLTLAAALLGWLPRAARRLPKPWIDALAVLIVATSATYFLFFWYHSRLVAVLPFSNLVVLGNWFFLFASALVGLVWNRIPGRAARRCATCGPLLTAAGFSLVWPLLGDAPSCADRWDREGFCQQTTSVSCTPACAASLLARHGIRATEQEMAQLCLTRSGTTWQGLYRGLKLKTKETSLQVTVISGRADEILEQMRGPMILSVGLESDAIVDGAFQQETGWRPGQRHSVILLRRLDDERVEILDPNPLIGRELWTMDELRMLFRGPAVQLQPGS